MSSLTLKSTYVGKQDRLLHTAKFKIKLMDNGNFKIWVDDGTTSRFDLDEDNRLLLIAFLNTDGINK